MSFKDAKESKLFPGNYIKQCTTCGEHFVSEKRNPTCDDCRPDLTTSFCVLPFMHLATHPNGTASLCCEADTLGGKALSQHECGTRPSNLDVDDVKTVLNGFNFKQYRKEMLQGKWPEPCLVCKKREDRGHMSKRQIENATWTGHSSQMPTRQELVDRVSSDGTLKEVDLSFVELRLGNTCNTACITCNPVSSSRWIKDSKELSEKLDWFEDIHTGKATWHDNPKFFNDLASNSTNLKRVYINGGEPTLIEAHFDYLQTLIDAKQTDVNLVYNINLTLLPLRLVELWKHFARVELNCSMDEIGLRNNYIRWPSKWGDVAATMDKICKLKEANLNIRATITQTISVFNGHRTDEFQQAVRERWGSVYIYHNLLHTPDWQTVDMLPEGLHYPFASNRVDNDDPRRLKLKQYLLTLDKMRRTNFIEIFPELEVLIK